MTDDLALFAVPIPHMPVFDASRCDVRPVSHQTAALVVAEAHYIGKLGSTSVALGMYIDDVLAGVLTYGTIPGPNAAAICGPDHRLSVMELTRLALYDWAPRNSESWFIGHTFRWMQHNRPDVHVLISYAEEAVGHVGTIYQATNWTYTGKSSGDVVWLCNDGRKMHPRTTGWDKSKLPAGKWSPSSGKFRYVRFLGSHTQRRTLRRQLRWDELPYPKHHRAAVEAA